MLQITENIAQLVRALVSKTKGYGFNSLCSRMKLSYTTLRRLFIFKRDYYPWIYGFFRDVYGFWYLSVTIFLLFYWFSLLNEYDLLQKGIMGCILAAMLIISVFFLKRFRPIVDFEIILFIEIYLYALGTFCFFLNFFAYALPIEQDIIERALFHVIAPPIFYFIMTPNKINYFIMRDY